MQTPVTLVEQITHKLSQLPAPKLHEVLDFVEFLTWQEQRSPGKVDAGELTSEQFMDELSQIIDEGVPHLSDYAVSRAGIYEDHS